MYVYQKLFPLIFVCNIGKKSLKSITITNPSLQHGKLCKTYEISKGKIYETSCLGKVSISIKWEIFREPCLPWLDITYMSHMHDIS